MISRLAGLLDFLSLAFPVLIRHFLLMVCEFRLLDELLLGMLNRTQDAVVVNRDLRVLVVGTHVAKPFALNSVVDDAVAASVNSEATFTARDMLVAKGSHLVADGAWQSSGLG